MFVPNLKRNKMKTINFAIDQKDLKVLFLHTQHAYNGYTFEVWAEEIKNNYTEYYKRNLGDLEKYGSPKTFSQWVNGQIISLT